MSSIKEQIESIDKAHKTAIRHVENTVRPLAYAVDKILIEYGVKKGRLRKRRKEYHFGGVFIVQYWAIRFHDIMVYYDGELVLQFDHWFPYSERHGSKDQYLHFYKGGDWERLVVDEYRRLRSVILREDFDMTGEECTWYDHNENACGKHEGRECICEDFEEGEP